ncbi:nucleotide pyrophosphohydrolase [Agromyces protaetiae]|uniref:Nucleotide pyrophosphohydrolase n=1 Tax=Agromyces protaetiae TaxID=2509455 RepID=A0A4P6FBQ8_9MICO|nr:nucleotide pyrophosphohydrolase [Agromyces protaetiae]QAY73720.1 nucleotide pyrophosphohydrolase [Agromyces protaetiae]
MLSDVTSEQVTAALRTFIAERDWEQFHTPENLAKSIAIEAGELLEEFQWAPEFDADRVRLELADVLTYCYELADRLGVDPEAAILEKLEITRRKYPVEVSRGRSAKYDRL